MRSGARLEARVVRLELASIWDVLGRFCECKFVNGAGRWVRKAQFIVCLV